MDEVEGLRQRIEAETFARKRAEMKCDRMQAQLHQAQKLESIGRLAAGIAHEINTPIQFVGDNMRFLQEGFADIEHLFEIYDQVVKTGRNKGKLISSTSKIAEEIDLDYLREEIPQAVAQSLDGINRVASIVSAMKEFSHPGDEKQKLAADINKIIQSTIIVSRNEWKYDAELVTDLDPGLPEVFCLAGELNQVILNIIVNASHAIRDARVNGSTDKGRILVSTQHDHEWVNIRIQDTGAGIPKEIRSKIFEPFFTTKGVGKGTGQGLAIAHSTIVEKHDGTIDVKSEMGIGTTFTIKLPIAG